MWYEDTNLTLSEWLTDDEGKPISLVWESRDYNSTQESWWIVVNTSDPTSKCWTDLYTYFNMTYITYSVVASDSDGKPIGVATCDLDVSHMAAMFLRQFQVERGVALLLDAHDRVLGSSVESIGQPVRNDRGELVPVDVSEVHDERVAAAQRYVKRHYGSWSVAANETRGKVGWTGGHVLIAVDVVALECLSLTVAVVAQPHIAAITGALIGIIVGITVVMVFVSALISWVLALPLRRLATEMRSITNLDFHKDRNMHSFVSEVSTIQESFTKLKGGIIAMTKYIPKPVVADILTRSVTSPLLGMESKYVSILFTDIRGFTTMAEALPREVVMGMLNDWIKSFTACIHGNHGIVDKYIGDCIMALFNSEYVDRPEYWACKTALDFSEALAVLNVDLTSKSLPMLETRVGLHVGDVLVGNIGCDVRVNYTVCGSVANTASRLEQLGKVYGVTPLISGELYRVVKDTFLCVWLDTVLLRGYQEQHTHVYHLVALKSDATPQQLKVHDSFHDLRAAINSTRWEVARGLLKEFQQDKAFVPYAQVPTLHDDERNRLRAGARAAARPRGPAARAVDFQLYHTVPPLDAGGNAQRPV
eukprot:TRINITY_DN1378_c0_g1_i8.p1 TRINITY_DN1378_c0_g1~~TRINITY_DN1378_c0_g1_i8.p1  ORF type:complete len:591 (-),score=99.54 TRINITY_DN1378_c0_g1_i8:1099-2871(-)